MFAVSGRCQDGHREQGAERRADFVQNILFHEKDAETSFESSNKSCEFTKKSKNPNKKSPRIFPGFSQEYLFGIPSSYTNWLLRGFYFPKQFASIKHLEYEI